MEVPFARETYKRVRAFTPEQVLRNLIVEKDESSSEPEAVMVLQRPGLVEWTTLPAPIQSIYTTDNALSSIPATFAVAGDVLYSIDEGTSTALGTMSGTTASAQIVGNFDRVAIVNAPLLYLYGASTGATTNSFRNVPIVDGYQAVDVTTLNGYFIVGMSDGTFYWLKPGDDNFTDGTNALDFATAESLPDGLVGVNTLNGNLFLFGSSSVEVWQPTGNADLPFQRTTGQDLQRGCLARDTIQHFDNSLLFVGDDAKVYRVSNVPVKISTDGIDERLKLRTDDPSAWTFSYDGHLFYVLRIPGEGTFAYDIASGTWSEFISEGYDFWRPGFGSKSGSITICGDSETGKIWQLADVSTDDGVLIRRTCSATAPIVGKPVRNDSFSLDIGSEAACQWSFRWCDSDQTLDGQPWETFQATGGSEVLTLRRMGQALAPYRQVEIEVTDPVAIRFSGGRLGNAWR